MKFLGFMWNPLSWVMEAAAIMAIALANGGVSASFNGLLYRISLEDLCLFRLFNEFYLLSLAGKAARLARLCWYHYAAYHQLYHQFY